MHEGRPTEPEKRHRPGLFGLILRPDDHASAPLCRLGRPQHATAVAAASRSRLLSMLVLLSLLCPAAVPPIDCIKPPAQVVGTPLAVGGRPGVSGKPRVLRVNDHKYQRGGAGAGRDRGGGGGQYRAFRVRIMEDCRAAEVSHSGAKASDTVKRPRSRLAQSVPSPCETDSTTQPDYRGSVNDGTGAKWSSPVR